MILSAAERKFDFKTMDNNALRTYKYFKDIGSANKSTKVHHADVEYYLKRCKQHDELEQRVQDLRSSNGDYAEINAALYKMVVIEHELEQFADTHPEVTRKIKRKYVRKTS